MSAARAFCFNEISLAATQLKIMWEPLLTAFRQLISPGGPLPSDTPALWPLPGRYVNDSRSCRCRRRRLVLYLY